MAMYMKAGITVILGTHLLLATGCATNQPDSRSASLAGSTLDSSRKNVARISKTTPIHVHLFSVEGIDLGHPKHADARLTMAKSASHLLATDIVHTLRSSGFQQVTLDDTEGGRIPGSLNLTGRFTVLTPGSQNLRLWIGFGAGRSKVAVEGRLTNDAGEVLGSFAHDEKGLGWGNSEKQVGSESHTMGEKIGLFIAGWAE